MELRIVKPKNMPDRFDSYAFIKFYDEEKHVDFLRKGILYMRSKEVFSNVEKEVMGDFLENKILVFALQKKKTGIAKYYPRSI